MRVSITGRPSTDTVYAQLKRDSDGKVWSGSDWVTRVSDTSESYVAMAWDSTSLEHAATIDVSAAHPSDVAGDYLCMIYSQGGESPDIASDRLIGAIPVVLQSGEQAVVATSLGQIAVDDILDGECDDGLSLRKVGEMLAALAAGKVTSTSSGGTTTLRYRKRDDTTTSFTVVVSEADNTRPSTGALS